MRTKDVQNRTYTDQLSLPKHCSKDDFIKEYCDFNYTKRGHHSCSINSGLEWNATTMFSHLTFSIFIQAKEIKNAVLFVYDD